MTRVFKTAAGIAALGSACFGGGAFAKDARPKSSSDWSVIVGAAAVVAPVYEGADSYTISPLPFFRVTWKDAVSLDAKGLNVRMIKQGGFKAGAGLTYDMGRDEDGDTLLFENHDDSLRGLGDIDPAIGVRAFASYDFSVATVSSSAVRYFGDDNDGLLIDASLSKRIPVGRRVSLTPSVKMTWADNAYMDTFFGVSGAQSARSGIAPFSAGPGFKDVSAWLSVAYAFSENWGLMVRGEVKQRLGDAADSPISDDDTSASMFTAITYRY